MFYFIIVFVVVFLVLDRVFSLKVDKVARMGIVELAKSINKEVHFYDYIKEATVHTLDFDLLQKQVEERQDFIDGIKKSVQRDIEAGDEVVAEAIQTLAKHLGLRIEAYHKPCERGLKITDLKEEKTKKK